MTAVSGSVLVDRFVENAVEIDVDALCDGEDVFIAAVMQHVEEAGVHSGDSSCVLPAQSLTLANALEVEHIVKRLAPALGVVGLLNIQLAIADSTVYVLEANPRASRTVPFASKAIGINLVEAACKLAAGQKLRDLALADAAAAAGQRQGRGAAVRPLPRRRPGARPRDALDRRGDGERLRPADRVREGRARRRPPAAASRHGVPLGQRHRQAERRARSPPRSPVSASSSSRPTARRGRCAPPGSRWGRWRRSPTPTSDEQTVVDLIRDGRCDLIVNTPQGSGARADGYRIREAALSARVPCITTISGAAAAVHAIANARAETALSLQERIGTGA